MLNKQIRDVLGRPAPNLRKSKSHGCEKPLPLWFEIVFLKSAERSMKLISNLE